MKYIIKALSLMSFQSGYAVSGRDQLFQNELNWLFLKTGSKPIDALFVSYAYKGTDYPSYFQQVSDIFRREGISLADISSGDPATLINSAKMIVVGGGDINTFLSRMNSLITPEFNPYVAIFTTVQNGIPYLGWNEGSVIASPKYFAPPASASAAGINASPFQILCNYSDSPLNRNAIFSYLSTNPSVKKVIAEIDQLKPDGTSVRLEDTGAGMIDSATAPFPIVTRFKIVNGVLVAE
jgi:hypothetical protein